MSKADVITAMMGNLESGNLEAAAAAVAEDAVWHTPEQDFSGRPEIMSYIESTLSGSDEVQMDMHDTLESDSHVVLLGTMKATREGNTFESPYVWVYHVSGDVMTEGWTVAFDGVGRAAFFS